MWFLYGLILGIGGTLLIDWVISENIDVGWYAWPLALLALGLGTLTVHHFVASYAELEPKAGWVGLIVFGIPALILAGAAVWSFV
ncbi:MAG: hypothetical protein QGH73_06730 [Rhodospirillales bacterium]|jgi:hypothetical protein|nr:dehalogenase [Rhodospirillaceae bacterium]MDP6430270.1 hypothetical protein [Rhodospirillales bacterium]MDP6643923.1 hypothetical protein [Rhodospirillales bacterium]MDP6841357.1 hypothetical protein [Rhodospirillales bacterium]|tara:strand:+ start:2290 stop:2544 length:255 start_codon:yes stop_codon:yes gene_type:complete